MRKTPALALALVAALALPAGAQVADVQPALDAPAGNVQVAPIPEIVVDTGEGIAAGIQRANKAMMDTGAKEAIVKITTCDAQTLPSIKAVGKITIIGCGDKPAGVGGDDTVDRTTLMLPNRSGSNPITFESPLVFRGVEFNGIPNRGLQVYSSLTIENSVLTGAKSQLGFTSAPTLIDFSPSKDAVKPEVIVKNSTFVDASPLRVTANSGKVTFTKNKVNTKLSASQAAILAEHSRAYTPDGSLPIVIEDNDFMLNEPASFSAAVRIARGDVKVHKNRFVIAGGDASASAIELHNPAKGQGNALDNVEVTYNTFTGGVALSNRSGESIPAGKVAIKNNDFSKAAKVLPTKKDPNDSNGTVTDKPQLDAKMNFWGNLDTKEVFAQVEPKLNEAPKPPAPKPPVPQPQPRPQPPAPAPAPAPAPQPTPDNRPSAQPTVGPASPRSVIRTSGETRFETAGKIAEGVKVGDAKAVILARGDVAADSVSAVPFAEEMDAPILLTPSDALHPVAEKEIKRLLPKGGTVYVMGGEVAIKKSVEDAVTKLGVKVERIAGLNRAGTAVATAEKLAAENKLKHVVVASGNDWQADLVAGPAAAEADGALLLTNGDKMAPETAAFLAKHGSVKTVTVGDDAAKAVPSVEHVTGADGEALSLAVAKRYFGDPKAAGVATTADFADALAGGVMVAEADGPLLLAEKGKVAGVREYLNSQKALTKVFVFGGEERFSTADVDSLTK